MKTIVFFNNEGGLDKTTLLYHLAWMYSELGVRTVALDLDPQSNLTSMFLSEDRLGELWDPNCLAQLKHYRSLMPLAMEAGKPIFHLKPADGAIGAHVAAVTECGKDFRRLARRLAEATQLELPAPPPFELSST